MTDCRGASAVEFALIGPLFLLMLCGIVAYGGYFWMANALQQVTNDSARAAIAGLDPGERASLARITMLSEISDYAYLTTTAATIAVEDLPDKLTVQVAYNASGSPFWLFRGVIPMPSQQMTRKASIRLGGY